MRWRGYCEKQVHREREIEIMPKSQYVDPGTERLTAVLSNSMIFPFANTALQLKMRKKIYSKQDLLNIYRDMAIIREFETMLNEIKTKSVYNGVEYNNPGPAHLSHRSGGVRRRSGLLPRHQRLHASAPTAATAKSSQRDFPLSRSSTMQSFTT